MKGFVLGSRLFSFRGIGIAPFELGVLVCVENIDHHLELLARLRRIGQRAGGRGRVITASAVRIAHSIKPRGTGVAGAVGSAWRLDHSMWGGPGLEPGPPLFSRFRIAAAAWTWRYGPVLWRRDCTCASETGGNNSFTWPRSDSKRSCPHSKRTRNH